MELPSLNELVGELSRLAEATKELGDPSVPVSLAAHDVRTSPTWIVGGKELTLTAGFTARVEEFNSLDDVKEVDDGGCLAQAPTSPASEHESAKRPPAIVLTADRAWLKYGLAGALRLGGGADLASIGFTFDAGTRIELVDYRRHSRNEIVGTTIASDLARPRFIFTLKDVLGLGEGEALVLKASGELQLRMTVSWADVLTAGMTSLTSLLKAASPVSITLKAGLTTSVDVSLDGSFGLCFARDAVGLRLMVNKVATTGIGATASAGVKAQFTNLDKAATAVLDTVLGSRYQSIVSRLQKADPDNLTPAERKLFDKVVARLGISAEVSQVDELLEALSRLRVDLEDKLNELAKSRVELGMTYEYRRTRTNETLIDAYVKDEKALASAHPDLVRGNLRRLLADAGDGEKYDLKSFLHRKTLDTRGSWGFGFSVGSLLKVSGIDTSELREVKERDAKGRSRLAFEALRGYAADFAGEKRSWTVNLAASMRQFVDQPKASDFDYGLHLSWTPTSKAGPADLDLLLDSATLFGAGSLDPASRTRLAGALEKGPCKFAVTQVYPEAALAEIAERAVADQDRKLLASAMAAALPFDRLWPERSVLALRRAVYAPILHGLIAGRTCPGLGPSVVRQSIGGALQKAGASTAGMELNGKTPVSLVEVLRLHRYFEGVNCLVQQVGAFQVGLASLAHVLGSQAGAVGISEIEFVWRQTRPFFSQAFLVRTVAHYFLLLAAEAGVTGLVERSARLDFDGEAMVLLQ